MVLKPKGSRVTDDVADNSEAVPMEPFRVAAFGDSLMWGQGLSYVLDDRPWPDFQTTPTRVFMPFLPPDA